MRSLDDVQRALRAKLQTDDLLKLVSTRVFLKTGVNLTAIRTDQNTDHTAVTKVVAALTTLGYPVA